MGDIKLRIFFTFRFFSSRIPSENFIMKPKSPFTEYSPCVRAVAPFILPVLTSIQTLEGVMIVVVGLSAWPS